MQPRMRLGVVGVFVNSQGKLLLCQRAKEKGAWQFPQGGVDEGENLNQAIVREMKEELGTERFAVNFEGTETTEYFFPKDLASSIVKKFDGQIHHWFRLSFEGNAKPILSNSDHEFNDYQWINPEEALDLVVDWKREAYQKGLRLLKLLA